MWRIDSGSGQVAYALAYFPALTGVTTWEMEVRLQPLIGSSLGNRVTVRLVDAVRRLDTGIATAGSLVTNVLAPVGIDSGGVTIVQPLGPTEPYITITFRRVGNMVSIWYAGQCVRIMGYAQCPTTTSTTPVVHIGQTTAFADAGNPEVRIASFKLLIGAVNPSPFHYNQTAI